MKIVWGWKEGKVHAWLEGSPNNWVEGRSIEEAIGGLVRRHSTLLGVVIKDEIDCRHPATRRAQEAAASVA